MEDKCCLWIGILNKLNCSDWSQFFPSMIATFVGFVLAILGMLIYDNIKKNSEKKSLRNNIKNELFKIQEVLRTIDEEDKVAKGNNSKVLRINPLKCYVWESAINTNKIDLLSKMSWYCDLLLIYDIINDFNQWQLLKANKLLEGKDVYAINTHLEELKNNLFLQVDDISIKLNK